MSKLWDVFETVFRDAHLAETLMSDPAARRALGSDPERMLLLFELRSQRVGEDAGQRRARGERREAGVRRIGPVRAAR